MQNIINETEILAYTYLNAFGFPNEAIERLIVKGKNDLERELEKLKSILETDPISLTETNDSLHALKGLLFHLGNNALARQLNNIHSLVNAENYIENIKTLLHFK